MRRFGEAGHCQSVIENRDCRDDRRNPRDAALVRVVEEGGMRGSDCRYCRAARYDTAGW